jgi:hypothetical protein
VNTQKPTLNVYSRPGCIGNLSQLSCPGTSAEFRTPEFETESNPLTVLWYIWKGALAMSRPSSSTVTSAPPSELALLPTPLVAIVKENRMGAKFANAADWYRLIRPKLVGRPPNSSDSNVGFYIAVPEGMRAVQKRETDLGL